MRNHWMMLAAMLFSTSGCRMAAPSAAPPNLERRLATIEHQRLTDDVSPLVRGTGDSFTMNSQSPRVQANRPFTGKLAGTQGTSGFETGLDSLSLADLADEAPAGKEQLLDPSAETASKDYVSSRPLPSLRATIKRDLKAMPSDLWRDTKRVYANPVNLSILGLTYGGCLAMQETGVDTSIEHHFNVNNDRRPPIHDFSEGWDKAFDAMGNPGTHFALAGVWYLVGQQTMDDKTYEVGKTLISALTINGLTVVAGQAATFDKAPNGLYGTFPSGHTSSSFVVASVMHEAYGALVGIPLYGIAGCVAFQRLDDREHYFSDVIMGGVLGLVVGHSVASGRNPEFFGWKLVPWASPQNGAGIAFSKTLD